MAWYKRREIYTVITAAIITIFLIQYHFDIPALKPVTDRLTGWGTAIAAITIGLGYINMLQRYGNKVKKRERGWPYSLWLIIGLIVVTLVGLIQGRTGDLTMYIYNYLVTPIGATFYSMAMFYMAAAAFRGYRFRSVESSILVIVAVILLLKNAPIGEVIWPGFGTIGTWLMDYPSMGVNRAIGLSGTLGSVALALRVLIGREYAYLAGTEES